METAFSRDPWSFYMAVILLSLLMILCAIAIVFYAMRKDIWILLTIIISGALTFFFIAHSLRAIVTGYGDYQYLIAMTIVNLAYLVFLIKLKWEARAPRLRNRRAYQQSKEKKND